MNESGRRQEMQGLANLVADEILVHGNYVYLEEWQDKAMCRELNPEIAVELFDENLINLNKTFVRKLCGECVVRIECLTFAIEYNQECLILGGLTPNERKSLNRNLLLPELKRRREITKSSS